MKKRILKIFRILLFGTLILIAIFALIRTCRTSIAKHALAETRRALRAQGFKTDLADFDGKDDAATRTRARLLSVSDWPPFYFVTNLEGVANGYQMDLLPITTNGMCNVIWKQVALTNGGTEYPWQSLRLTLDQNQAAIDGACKTALFGPIHFEPPTVQGGQILLRLAACVNGRVLLDLHDGNPDAAWTNLLVVTHLVAAWKAGPDELGLYYDKALTEVAFADTWHALQYGGWPD